MQVVLLAVSVMYFFIGTTLEYTRRSEKILFVMTFLYGLLKIYVRLVMDC